MSDEDLTLGFSLTQPATVKLYVYNFLGNQVYTAEEYKSSAGYNSITINYYEDFIVPGIFICRIVTEDDDGNKSSKLLNWLFINMKKNYYLLSATSF